MLKARFLLVVAMKFDECLWVGKIVRFLSNIFILSSCYDEMKMKKCSQITPQI